MLLGGLLAFLLIWGNGSSVVNAVLAGLGVATAVTVLVFTVLQLWTVDVQREPQP